MSNATRPCKDAESNSGVSGPVSFGCRSALPDGYAGFSSAKENGGRSDRTVSLCLTLSCSGLNVLFIEMCTIQFGLSTVFHKMKSI